MNNPFVTKFAAQAGDINLSNVSNSKTFQLLKDSVLILKETYNYDADHKIRITGLADVLSQALYGQLLIGEQTSASGLITLKLTGEEDITSTLYAMRLLNPRDPSGLKTVLAVAPNGVCYPGKQLLITVIGEVTVGLVGTNYTTAIGTQNKVMTVNCDPAVLFSEHYQEGVALNFGSEVLRTIKPGLCDNAITVRFLNRYDMPECITASYMTEKPSVTDDVSRMFGQKTRFSVESSTEYTLLSGQLNHEDEYDTWQDLLTSRKAQIFWRNQWIDIIITKSNYQRQRRNMYKGQVEISFQTTNPNILL